MTQSPAQRLRERPSRSNEGRVDYVSEILRAWGASVGVVGLQDSALTQSPVAKTRPSETEAGGLLDGPVVIAVATGMRLGEVLGLRWSDVDLDRGRLHVTSAIPWTGGAYEFVPPKTKKSRRPMVLPEFAVRRKHRAKQSASPSLLGRDVAWSRRGARSWRRLPTDIGHYEQFVREARPKRDCSGVRFHDLRHPNATALLQASVHPRVVSEALGHSSVAFTMEVSTSTPSPRCRNTPRALWTPLSGKRVAILWPASDR